MTRLPLFALALLAASPGLAEINHQARLGATMRQGCSVQQVHTPAGKTVHALPVVRCPEQGRGQSAQPASSQSLSVSVANRAAR